MNSQEMNQNVAQRDKEMENRRKVKRHRKWNVKPQDMTYVSSGREKERKLGEAIF